MSKFKRRISAFKRHWCRLNLTDRILLYIAFVVTVSSLVAVVESGVL